MTKKTTKPKPVNLPVNNHQDLAERIRDSVAKLPSVSAVSDITLAGERTPKALFSVFLQDGGLYKIEIRQQARGRNYTPVTTPK